jgi:hypothetical protein
MIKATHIVPEPERPSRLFELGLDGEAELRDAMYAADAAAARVTKNHPRGWANLERYGYGIAELRAILVSKGWTIYREDGLEGVMSADGRLLIIVSSGCKRTGRDDDPIQPETKNVKGPKFSAKIEENAQFDIFSELDRGLRVVPEATRSSAETWILLHHKDRRTGELRLELSCPNEIMAGRLSSWRERIPLTPFPGDHGPEVVADAPDWPAADTDEDLDLDWRDDAAGA